MNKSHTRHESVTRSAAQRTGEPDTAPRRPRLGAVLTSWHHGGTGPVASHAQVIIGRWLTPLESDREWGWHGPRTELAAVYTQQLRAGDELYALSETHDLPLVESVDAALTGGGDQLNVDGVLLIGEHGPYASNALGQKMYPRKELFDQIVAVFERTGQTAPVFCDKHFSWRFDWARQMVDTAERMGFMLFGGSSVPHTTVTPALPPADTHPPTEIVCVYPGELESYGFHSMEFVQSRVENRPGGEAGVRRITAYEGASLQKAAQHQYWSPALQQAALDAAQKTADDPQPDCAFVVDHWDGLRVTHLHINPGVKSWAIAMHCRGEAQPRAATAVMGNDDNFYAHFARLSRVIEDAMLSGKAPFPVERTLLATGALDAAMHARRQPGRPHDTPQLAIAYDPRHGAS